jgi:hypothetical protein
MKRIVLTAVMFCSLFVSCKDSKLNFIPGTYARSVKNEFSVGRDTLMVLRESENTFTIIHHGIYRRIIEGEISRARSFSEKWRASYDEGRGVLIEERRGKILSFDRSKGLLFLGGSSFEKISGK